MHWLFCNWSDQHERWQPSFGYFCVSAVTWPHKPVSFSHLLHACSGSSSIHVTCEYCVYMTQFVGIQQFIYTVGVLKHGRWMLQDRELVIKYSWWCETISLNCGHCRAYCSSPTWYEHGEPWWNDIGMRNSRFIHQSSLVILPGESCSSKAGGTG
jgi:hypothetical protein